MGVKFSLLYAGYLEVLKSVPVHARILDQKPRNTADGGADRPFLYLSAYQAASKVRITGAAISRPTASMQKIPESRFDRYTDGLVNWICKQQILNKFCFFSYFFF